MNTDNDLLTVKQACMHISLLMEHQEIVPDLREIALELGLGNSSEYIAGASAALVYLITFLSQKGVHTSE